MVIFGDHEQSQKILKIAVRGSLLLGASASDLVFPMH